MNLLEYLLSTIHAAKGGEQDNVILCLDLGNKIKKAVKKSKKRMMKNIEFGM